MTINVSEQRELADYIARKIARELGLQPARDAPNSKEKQVAEIVWNAIEDYTFEPTGPDILEMHKASENG